MQGVPFETYRLDFMKLKASEQELMSALYAVHPVPVNEPEHFIVVYADMTSGAIEFNILTEQMMDLRLFAQVPHDVLIRLGELLVQIRDWREGKALYPHSQYTLPDFMQPAPQSDVGSDRLSELNEREAAANALIESAAAANKERS